MWIQGKGDHADQLINTAHMRKLYMDGTTLRAKDTSGNGIPLMKFGEKADGVAMIGKVGRLIATGCQYISLESPDDPVFNNPDVNNP